MFLEFRNGVNFIPNHKSPSTPLVAFDGEGNRLGMGGGYYDQTFGYKSRRRAWRKPMLIGVAYEFQRLSSLPARSWDVALDGIVTEKGFQKFPLGGTS